MPKISNLQAITSPADDDELAVVDTSAVETKRFPLSTLVTYVKTALQAVTSWINTDMINNPYKFSAYRSSSISLTDSSLTTVVYDTEDFDTNSDYNNTTGEYTVPIDGYYQFNASAILHGNPGVNLWLWQLSMYLQADGTEIDSSHLYVYDQGRITFGSLRISGVYYLTAGQVIRVRVLADKASGSPTANSYATKAMRFNGFLQSEV